MKFVFAAALGEGYLLDSTQKCNFSPTVWQQKQIETMVVDDLL